MEFLKLVVCFCSVVTTLSSALFVSADTDPRDVAAMNSLWISLDLPPLEGWQGGGGDPCGEQWEGVSCVFSNITSLKLNDMDLGGNLDLGIDRFESIIEMDLSNNHIGGSIPINFPPTLRNFSLAGNLFSGSIPSTLSSLNLLLDLSLSNNLLSGGIPDAFQELTNLVNLDLSWNNLSDVLPPSMGNLLSLSSLNLQNNKLIGTLDVLQDLPLQNLNVEDNLFSGHIPSKLSAIPNFRKDGNSFNTTIPPSPPAPPPPQVSSPSPSPSVQPPWIPGFGPSSPEKENPGGQKKEVSTSHTKKVVVVAAAGIAAVILLGLCVCLPVYCKRRKTRRDPEDAMFGGYNDGKLQNKASLQVYHHEHKAPKGLVMKLDELKRPETSLKTQDEHVALDRKRMALNSTGVSLQQCPPPPPRNKVAVNEGNSMDKDSSSAGDFTIAALQQYTNSFAEENYVGEGSLSRVYKAELPDGELVAVKKLNVIASRKITDEEFLHLVSAISRIKHPNIAELVGHCLEHGHKLLVYKYCESGTLHGALHSDEEIHGKLSWNKRVRLALGAARALQYLHELCQPPVVHQNFKSANILLDYQLVAKVSDCGLGSLNSSSTSNEFLGRHHSNSQQFYNAPELDSGSPHSCKSDVYSFGVVMLELLTGRKSYDSSRARGEQYLVRWALPQLHDIDSLSRMVDPSLNGSYTAKSLSRFADIISRCIQWEPEFRPAMSEVVQDLLQMI